MKLIPVSKLPKGAVKDSEPLRMNDHGGATVQDYRCGDDLYEYVKKDDGTVRIFKVENVHD